MGSAYLMFFILIVIIFLMIISFSNADNNEIYSVRQEPPIIISPSNVRVCNSIPRRLSPGIQSNNSFINDPPIIRKNSIPKYCFNPNNRKLRSKGEIVCCKVFEEYLGREVKVNIRPDFLKNPETGRNLELDLFDPISKTAIEYDGQEHFKFCSYFHKNMDDFTNLKKRDHFKDNKCKELGIKLIRIPYFIDTCKKNKTGNWYYVNRNEKEREELIKSYLIPLLNCN